MKLNKNYLKTTTLLLTLFLTLGFASANAPGEPAPFYGEINDEDDNLAPVGTMLYGVVDGDEEASIEVTEEGLYGEEGAFGEKLTLDGAGDEVSFHVESASGPESVDSPYDLESGTEEVNLTFPDDTFDTSTTSGTDEEDCAEDEEWDSEEEECVDIEDEEVDEEQEETEEAGEDETDEETEEEEQEEAEDEVREVEPEVDEENRSATSNTNATQGETVKTNIPENIQDEETTGTSVRSISTRARTDTNVNINFRKTDRNQVEQKVAETVEETTGEPSAENVTRENQIDFTEIEVEGDIDQQVIEFTVRESVLEERSAEPGDVVKERFNESSTEWEELDTSYLDQEDDRYVFEATVEDNSIFATTITQQQQEEREETTGIVDRERLPIAVLLLVLIIAGTIAYLQKSGKVDVKQKLEELPNTKSSEK